MGTMRRELRSGKTQGRSKNIESLKLSSGSKDGNEVRAITMI